MWSLFALQLWLQLLAVYFNVRPALMVKVKVKVRIEFRIKVSVGATADVRIRVTVTVSGTRTVRDGLGLGIGLGSSPSTRRGVIRVSSLDAVVDAFADWALEGRNCGVDVELIFVFIVTTSSLTKVTVSVRLRT